MSTSESITGLQPDDRERPELDEQVQRRLFELEILYELSQRIGYTLDYGELSRLFQASLHRIVQFDLSASLILDDPASGRHDCTVTYYLPQPVAPALKAAAQENLVAVFERISGHELQEFDIVELYADDYESTHSPTDTDLQSFFNVPLIVKDETIGLLHVASVHHEAFNETEVRLLYAVADQAATAVQRLQALLAKERAHLEAIVTDLQEGIILLGQKGRIKLINPAATAILKQFQTADLRPGYTIERAAPIWLQAVHSRIDQLQDSLSKVVTLWRESGPYVEVCAGRLTVSGRQGLLLVLRDVTEQRRYEKMLRQQSRTDPLTGLANRRYLFTVLEAEIERAHRYDVPLSLMICDLDDFKRVNDTCGHQAGDDVLRQVADILRGESRQTDLPARYGGDEFVLLLPHTSAHNAAKAGQRIVRAIHCMRKETYEDLGMSAGIATLRHDDDKEGESLLARADEALYRAKRRGGGRIEIEQSDDEEAEGVHHDHAGR